MKVVRVNIPDDIYVKTLIESVEFDVKSRRPDVSAQIVRILDQYFKQQDKKPKSR
jgi:hypothetical protein